MCGQARTPSIRRIKRISFNPSFLLQIQMFTGLTPFIQSDMTTTWFRRIEIVPKRDNFNLDLQFIALNHHLADWFQG